MPNVSRGPWGPPVSSEGVGERSPGPQTNTLYTYHPAFSWTPGCSMALTSALPFCGLFPEAMSQHAPVPLWSQVLQLPPWLVFLFYAQTSWKLCHLPSAVGGESLAGSVCTLYLGLASWAPAKCPLSELLLATLQWQSHCDIMHQTNTLYTLNSWRCIQTVLG